MTQDLLSTPAVAISDLNNPAQITQNNNQNTESSFSTIIDEAMLSQEFKELYQKHSVNLAKLMQALLMNPLGKQTQTYSIHSKQT